MKLLLQSDDYGMTKAVAQGALEGIRNGIVRNTGLFSNMPWAAEVVEWIKPYVDNIGFGLDLNISTGPSLCEKAQIPGLLQENGLFNSSSTNRKLDTDENNHDHCAALADQVRLEFETQIQKFIEIVGKKPDYLHDHAYHSATTRAISIELAEKYGIPYSATLKEHYDIAQTMGWYIMPATFENQLAGDPISFITSDKGGLLKHEYGHIVTHCGYVDAQLLKWSSFNLNRVKDLEAVTSDEVKQWVKDNQIELITYKDLK